jgi:hypothetical protein
MAQYRSPLAAPLAMSFFPPAFLEELRSRVSLAQVIGRQVRLT